MTISRSQDFRVSLVTPGGESDYVLRQHHDSAHWDPTTGRTLSLYADNRVNVDGKILKTFPVGHIHSSLAVMIPYSPAIFIWEWPYPADSGEEGLLNALLGSYSAAELRTRGIRVDSRSRRRSLRPEGAPLLYLWDSTTDEKVAIQNVDSLADRRSEFSVALVHGEQLIIGTNVGTLLHFDLKNKAFVREEAFKSSSPIDDLQWDGKNGQLLVLHRSGEIRIAASGR